MPFIYSKGSSLTKEHTFILFFKIDGIETKTAANGSVNKGLPSTLWPVMWDSPTREAKAAPTLESFPTVSTSISLFASTPFDMDGKLEKSKDAVGVPLSEDDKFSEDNFPLFTFHDVKTPGLTTPFVDTDSSVPKFWPNEPIPPLETLIPTLKQKRNTNWVNFLDESSSGASNLPSPGMPQSTKTVAEIWDAVHLADENDGWSTAFSPTLDPELSSPAFSSFHQPYESAWSTGTYQQEYYGMPSENAWGGACSGAEAELSYQEDKKYTSSSHQLNPYSEPWDASGLANKKRWSPAPPYHE